jgi:hypothetical protein
MWPFNSQNAPVKAKFVYLFASNCCRLRNALLMKLCSSWDDGATAGNSLKNWRIPSSGMWRHVALVRTDVLEEGIVSIIRVKRISKEGILAVTSNWSALFLHSMRQLPVTANGVANTDYFHLMMEAVCSSKMLILTRATWCHFPEDGILHSRCREYLKSYTVLKIVYLDTLRSCSIGCKKCQ